MGGAILSEVPVDDDPASFKFVGSTVIIEASSREEILGILGKDVYVESGVWDLDKVRSFSLSLSAPLSPRLKYELLTMSTTISRSRCGL
jgi:hypothetical protein